MFLGAYWGPRRDSAADAAARIAGFLGTLVATAPSLSHWYHTGDVVRTDGALPLAAIDARGVQAQLDPIRTDSDQREIPELGWHMALWNGADVDLSVSIGIRDNTALNCVVLSFGPDAEELPQNIQSEILSAMIRTFDPDRAIATDNRLLDAVHAEFPWEVGWLTFSRGGRLSVGGSRQP